MELLLLPSLELDVAKLYNPLSLTLLVLVFSLVVIWLNKQAKGTKLNLPPSPPKLPIIGNIHQVGKLPHRSLRDLSRKYGSLLLMQLGDNPTLVVSSADMAKEIVKNHDIVFSNRPRTTGAETLLYGCSDVGFAPYGEYWRQVRKICVLELFSLRRVQSFQCVRDEEVEDLINKIRRACVKGESINLSEMLMAVSNNIVSRCVLSKKTEEEDGKVGQLSRRLLGLLTRFCFGDMFPYLRWMDVLTGLIRRMKAVSRELDTLFDQIIEEHRALKNYDTKRDFISIILQLQRDGLLEMELTHDNIKAILLDMFVGGTDTTSTTIEWLMGELIKHPCVMKKVQEEVSTDISNGYIDGYIETTVFINAFAIQRDPNGWEKPEEFIPERFENSPIDFKGQDFQFIPFGSGRRGCSGMAFGVASIEYEIGNLLYWFDWKLLAGEIPDKLDMTELYGLTVNKKVPLHVLPIIPHLFT
ncbi:Cytochrome P450 [Corchorus capsularis]|uniref:Cytochrome P450 n=1 Tax=Corchorus capsularis TaxID=210143 RepID=A0A1R3KG10_COCAP|nr:Cytochrome P450 [Corchorus capsularis]